jgi:hypothetical protein
MHSATTTTDMKTSFPNVCALLVSSLLLLVGNVQGELHECATAAITASDGVNNITNDGHDIELDYDVSFCCAFVFVTKNTQACTCMIELTNGVAILLIYSWVDSARPLHLMANSTGKATTMVTSPRCISMAPKSRGIQQPRSPF